MQNRKKKTVTYESTVIESTTCDICKKTYQGDGWGEKDQYEVLETDVQIRLGYNFPEGGSGEEVFFDICPECFKNRLIPTLKEMGAEPTKKDWSY